MRPLIRWPNLTRTIALIAWVGLVGACATISTGSHYDETNNFGLYETFSWIDENPYINDASSVRVDPLTQSKIQNAIQDKLEQKGYSFVEDRDNADFVLAYVVGTREKIRISSYPVGYRGSWGWHVHGSHYYVHEYTQHSYTEGTLSIDIFDGKTKQPVWHGWAEKSITESDRKDPSAIIKEGVAKLLESFPR
jgi:hypothetical protein